jgi:nicotinamidase-related amidase
MDATSETRNFYVDVDLGATALLLADMQEDIASRLPKAELQDTVLSVLGLVNDFRKEIQKRREHSPHPDLTKGFDQVPLIVHHVFPAGINSNGFISPYNKLARWFHALESAGHFDREAKDPNHPQYRILKELRPKNDAWGSKDEIIIPKLSAGSFSSSELLGYFRARGIRHIVLCGLTTAGAVLGSARLGADLDFHIIVPREGVMDDDKETNDSLLNKVLPRFVDVVSVSDVKSLFK